MIICVLSYFIDYDISGCIYFHVYTFQSFLLSVFTESVLVELDFRPELAIYYTRFVMIKTNITHIKLYICYQTKINKRTMHNYDCNHNLFWN